MVIFNSKLLNYQSKLFMSSFSAKLAGPELSSGSQWITWQVLERLKTSDHAALVVFFRARMPSGPTTRWGLGVAPIGKPLEEMDTLWWTYKKLWKMAIEIVDFPIKNGGFSIAMLVHQRVPGDIIFPRWIGYWLGYVYVWSAFSFLGNVWISRHERAVILPGVTGERIYNRLAMLGQIGKQSLTLAIHDVFLGEGECHAISPQHFLLRGVYLLCLFYRSCWELISSTECRFSYRIFMGLHESSWVFMGELDKVVSAWHCPKGNITQ